MILLGSNQKSKMEEMARLQVVRVLRADRGLEVLDVVQD